MGWLVLLAIGLLVAVAVIGLVIVVFAAVKVFQIAEDLRYLRSKDDSSIEPPIPAKKEIEKVSIYAVLVIVLGVFVVVFRNSLYSIGVFLF